MAATATSSQLAQQILDHKAPHYTFNFSPFLRKTYNFGLGPNRPICKDFQATGQCPRGNDCPDRHETSASAYNAGSSERTTVCKHWLRALCKKGETCEFLHEYNLRKMPECNFFNKNGYCSNGDECLYRHIDAMSKLSPCPHYERGFCPLGPECSQKHTRRVLCPYYLAGFCPDGPMCKQGAHPRWEKNLDRPIPKSEKAEENALKREQMQQQYLLQQQQQYEMYGDDDHGGRRDRDDGGGRFRGGRGGRGGWRGRGDKRFGRGRGGH
jgi:cleavage and polyadenylation specificity factor subunit 4